MTEETKTDPYREAQAIMRRLRDPVSGCPWDRAQDFGTIVKHTIEEAYEVAEAIERGDWADVRGELGDLFFQVVFYAELGREAGLFDLDEIVAALNAKMIEQHPHVFGAAKIATAGAQTIAWEAHKAKKRAAAAEAAGRPPSALDGVIAALPALVRADKLQKRAARIGFDWPKAREVVAKIAEEAAELQAEIDRGDKKASEGEIGDLFFALVNLARHLDIDAETALRRANAKFEGRFRAMEEDLRQAGIDPATAGLDRLEGAWQAVKAKEKDGR